jgi:hypothetical protein
MVNPVCGLAPNTWAVTPKDKTWEKIGKKRGRAEREEMMLHII